MARSLVQSKIAKEIQDASGAASEKDDLQPGHMRLYSYYSPSLSAGLYGIEVRQTVTAIAGDDLPEKAQTLPIMNQTVAKPGTTPVIVPQEFNVVAPQFSLDSKLINTYYPPDGHQDEGRVLPHIVFNDPHVPWFREAGTLNWETQPVDGPQERRGRNFVPWLALMVFEPDELKVEQPAAALLKLDQIPSYNSASLPANGSFSMTVGQYLSLISSRPYYEEGYQGDAAATLTALKNSTDKLNVIFPTKSQLADVFAGPGSNLDPLKAQKYLAHVRHINTIGFPDAGVEEEGFFSVVVSSMTGNQKELIPSTHVVHLVSIEHFDTTFTAKPDPKSTPPVLGSTWFYPDDVNSDRIGIVSLFSWTYTCIPDAISFYETMQVIGATAQPLRPPQKTLDNLWATAKNPNPQNPAAAPIAQKLYDRLNSGYTIARWRTATGEETTAFNRGPLVPMNVQEVPGPAAGASAAKPWPGLSMTGKDYTVFDKSIGMMDTTYSGAWSLGKLMAISDSAFNQALMRFRSSIWEAAASYTRMQANNVTAAGSVLSNVKRAFLAARAVTPEKFSGPVIRINKPVMQGVTTSMDDPSITEEFQEAIQAKVATFASIGKGTTAPLYNGFDGAPGNNSDWEILLNWVHDIMYLGTIPSHVLFPEPSHLQSHNDSPIMPGQPTYHPEALRWFHIDHAWIDCFLDGALSCANHLEPEYDFTRLCVKDIFNKFLSTPIGNTSILPPVPRYGFILRSAVVKSTPDIRLVVTCWKLQKAADGTPSWVQDPDRDPLVRHTKMDDFTILSLVDCSPEEIHTVTLAQPPHQQRFSIGCEPSYDPKTGLVTAVAADIKLKELFTDASQVPVPTPQDPEVPVWSELPEEQQIPMSQQTLFYNDATRCIDAAAIATAANSTLNSWASDPTYPTKPYDDAVANSTVFGLEMNDPSYQLRFTNPAPKTFEPFPTWTRKIYTGAAPTPPPSAITVNAASKTLARGPIVANILSKTGTVSIEAIPSVKRQRPAQQGPSLYQAIQLAPPDPTRPTALPPRVMLNSMRAVPRALPAAHMALARPPTPGPFNPWAPIGTPQFELLVHPDYRPAPPRPIHDPNNNVANDVFSPFDYIPTQTTSLFDLVFSIRRRVNDNTDLQLQSITIEIPVSDGSDKKNADGYIREPLLEAGDYSGTGVHMCSNPRFVPAIFSGTATPIGSDKWDNKPVVGIRLVPRTGQATGTLPLVADLKSKDAGFRLSEPRIKPIVDHSTSAMIAALNSQGNPTNVQKVIGRCMIRMSEQYGPTHTDTVSWCTVLKADTGDHDPWGNQI
ncbi:hypothetical protein GQ53DRAFT_814848 [Thozetella sp. PMI_491]|nr:hypothetical protein GQ53DRAFT_814848 [Thozetella sp. PMI_491]